MYRKAATSLTLPIIFSGCFCILGVGDCDEDACSDESRNAITTAYATALAYPDDLPGFVGSNEGVISNNAFGFCISTAADQMINAALQAPSRSEVDAQATDIATRAGVYDQSFVNNLSDDLYGGTADLYAVGEGLSQLNIVLDQLLAGDVSGYQRSSTYQNSSFVWVIMNAYAEDEGLGSDFVPSLRRFVFDLHVWYVGTLLTAVR